MYRFAICDDAAADADYIKSLILEWNREAGHPLRIESYPSAEAFLFAYEDDDSVDVLFLDIEMKEMSGVELAGRLREMGAGLQIVFITGYMDYIEQGYDVEALHYLLKPVTGEKLRHVLERAMKRLSARGRPSCSSAAAPPPGCLCMKSGIWKCCATTSPYMPMKHIRLNVR